MFKANVPIFCVISFNSFCKFLLLGNSSWDFFGVLFEALGIFLGFEFCSHSIIPVA